MRKTNKFIGTVKLFSHGILDMNSSENRSAWAFLIIRDGMEYIVSENSYDYSKINVEVKALINALENLKEKNWNDEKIVIYLTSYDLLNIIFNLNRIDLNKLMIPIKDCKNDVFFKLKRLLIFFTDISFCYTSVPDKRIDSVLKKTMHIC